MKCYGILDHSAADGISCSPSLMIKIPRSSNSHNHHYHTGSSVQSSPHSIYLFFWLREDFFWLREESRGKSGEGAGFRGASAKKVWDENGVTLLSPWNASFSRLGQLQPGNHNRSSMLHFRPFPIIPFHVSFRRTVMQTQRSRTRAAGHRHTIMRMLSWTLSPKTDANGLHTIIAA